MWMWILLGVVILFAALFILGMFVGDDEEAEESPRTQVHAFVSEKKGDVSIEEARRLQEHFISVMQTDVLSDKINAAAKLMLAGLYQEAMDAYAQIAQEHPEEEGACQGQMGAALYFMGRYDDALAMYKVAKQNGADEAMMDDNIKEAEEALAKS